MVGPNVQMSRGLAAHFGSLDGRTDGRTPAHSALVPLPRRCNNATRAQQELSDCAPVVQTRQSRCVRRAVPRAVVTLTKPSSHQAVPTISRPAPRAPDPRPMRTTQGPALFRLLVGTQRPTVQSKAPQATDSTRAPFKTSVAKSCMLGVHPRLSRAI